MGACSLLPRIVGLGRASELLYSGRAMGGEEAQRMGFFNRCEPTSCSRPPRKAATMIASGPTFAHAMTKSCIHQEWNMGLDEAIEAEAQAQAICMQTNDFDAPTRRSSEAEARVRGRLTEKR